MGYTSWSTKELDMTEQLTHTHTHTHTHTYMKREIYINMDIHTYVYICKQITSIK